MFSLLHMPEITAHAEQKLSAVDAELWPAIHADIIRGDAQLFQCPDDSYLVLRIEDTELVIVACVGKGGILMMQRCLEIARCHGLLSVRFHTQRCGMVRLLKQFKPVELERVYRIKVA
jgi:hypothetical protein